MNSEEGKSRFLYAAPSTPRCGELLTDVPEAALETLVTDLLHLSERIQKRLKTIGIDRERVQLNAKFNSGIGSAAFCESIRQIKRKECGPGSHQA